MQNTSTGAGLALLGFGIAAHPVIASFASSATASVSSVAGASATAAVASTQAGPTVVWMGVTTFYNQSVWVYHRMWSDGRIESRSVNFSSSYILGCLDYNPTSCTLPWRESVPAPGGNGFACRSDINGDRIVDGADLAFVLDGWGQQGGCEPEATYPCLDLASIADNAVAAK